MLKATTAKETATTAANGANHKKDCKVEHVMKEELDEIVVDKKRGISRRSH